MIKNIRYETKKWCITIEMYRHIKITKYKTGLIVTCEL